MSAEIAQASLSNFDKNPSSLNPRLQDENDPRQTKPPDIQLTQAHGKSC
jgi:hypothetical protein